MPPEIAPAAAPAPAPAAAPAPAPATAAPAAGAAPAAPAGNLVADAKGAPAAAPAAPTLDEAKAFLTSKGVTAEDLAKLDEAGIRAKHEELSKAAPAKAAAVDPKSIALKMPEGFTIDEATLTGLQEVLADANLSPQDRGQKLVDMHVAAMKAAVEAPMALWNKTQADWQAEIKADKEVGGQNFQASQATVARVLDTVAGPKGSAQGDAVRQAFNMTGAGNNPALFKFMVAMGKHIAESAAVPGNSPTPGRSDQATLSALYPSAQPKA